METTDEIDLVLEKICDIHDKLSNAIHSISRSHFLNSIKSINHDKRKTTGIGDRNGGFVFMKDVRMVDDAVIADVRSLNSIRIAVENLQHQLEFLNTVQLQQRVERDTAIARLEQSRIVLAMRLANHQGKKYKVIEEALAFVGNVDSGGHFISPEHLFESPGSQSGESSKGHGRKRSNFLMRTLASGLSFAKKSLNLSPMGSLLGHAALVAVSMVALLHLPPSSKRNFLVEVPQIRDNSYYAKSSKKTSEGEISSTGGFIRHLDVLAARG